MISFRFVGGDHGTSGEIKVPIHPPILAGLSGNSRDSGSVTGCSCEGIGIDSYVVGTTSTWYTTVQRCNENKGDSKWTTGGIPFYEDFGFCSICHRLEAR